MLFPTKCLLAALLLFVSQTSFAQVSNDDCSNATELTIGSTANCDFAFYGSTLGAGASGLGICNPQGNDVWYSFVATTTSHYVRVINVRNANYTYIWESYSLEIFSGNCDDGTLQQMHCLNQDFNVPFGDLTPGDTYYVRVTNPYNTPIVFQICVNTPNQPPPANDACMNATVLTVEPAAVCSSSVAGTTQNSSVSPMLTCTYCYPLKDVWYSFTATQPLEVVTLSEVKYANQNGYANFHVEAYTGTCGNLVSLDHDADLYLQGTFFFNDLIAGQTYFMRISPYYSDDAVQFNICVTAPPPPANDACSGAIPVVPAAGLDCGVPLSGSLLGALPSGTDCQGAAVHDVWYQFNASSSSQRIVLSPSGSDDYGFEAYSGDCDNLVSINCAQQGYYLSQTLSGLTVGATYYLRVFSPTVTSFDFQVCVLTLPLPPVNDECSAALPVNPDISGDISSTTLGATSSLPACNGTESTHDVWYSFVATSVSHRILLYNIVTDFGSYDDLRYEVYKGDCDNLVSLACGPTPNYGYQTLVGGLTPGETYFIRVYSIFGSNHEFTLTLQTLPPPPLNGDCAQAEILVSAAQPGCGAPASGSTEGVLTTKAGTCLDGKELWYKFTATHSTHVVQVSDLQSPFGYNNGYWLELQEGTDCNNLKSIACFTNPGTVYLNQLTVGKTYYLRWVNPPATAHTFNICLSHFDPPVNDLCAGALPLTVHGNMNCYYPTQGTTAGSTAEQPDACLTNGDVWFRFTAIQTTQQLVLSNIKTAEDGSFAPLKAELLSGACGNGNSLYCRPEITSDPFALIAGDLTPGETYYLRVAGLNDVPTHFDVCALTPPKPPANDNCSQATVLIPEAGDYCTYTYGSTQYASPAPGLPLPSNGVEGDVWYSFTASQANQVVSIGSAGAYPYNDYKVVVETYSSGCGNFNLINKKTIDYSGSTYLSNLNPGATYHVRVYPESNPYINFSICVSAPTAPSNDACADALPLPVNSGFDCDNTLTTNTLGATQSRADCDGNASNDIWYQFTATDATYRFTVYEYANEAGNGGIEVLSGDCDQLVSLFCRPLTSTSQIFQEIGFIPGETYYLRIWNKLNTYEQWNICAVALPAAPANDDCANATPLPVNTALPCAASVSGTTLSANQSQPGCSGETVHDIWYTFTATSVANLLDVNITGSYFGAYYAGYELFSGDCNTANSLICRDYFYGHLQEVLPDLTPGETYFMRLFNYDFQAQDFQICLTALPAPPNDACAQAAPVAANSDLACNTVYPGTTAGATFDDTFTEPDVWYVLTANSSTLLFQLLNVQMQFGQYNNLAYQVYHGSSCDDWQLEGTYNPAQQVKIDGLIPGDTYFIRVFSNNTYSAYAFDLCIQTLPPPPPNDACADALPLIPNTGLDCDIVTHGSTAGTVAGIDYGCYQSGNVYDVWYTFTATSPNHLVHADNITPVTGSGAGMFEMALLESADCESFNILTCTTGDVMYLQGLTPGFTYYLMVNSGEGVFHDFDLCITTYPIPSNDLCENAIPLDVSPTPNCDNLTAGTTFSGGPSGAIACGSDESDVWYSFTAVQSAHIISVTNAVNAIGGYAYYFGLEVYAGDCGNLQSLICRPYLYGADQFTLGDLVPGTQYFIRIRGSINFNICVSSPETPPSNDACIGATEVPVSPDMNCTTPVSGTTINATVSTPGAPNNYGVKDVWYKFTATQANHAVVFNNVVNPYGNYINAEIYEGTCGALTKIALQQYYLPTGNLWMATNLTPGSTYYVRVFDGNGAPSTFDICIFSIPVPANDACANAMPLVVNTGLDCQQNNSVSTFGATQSNPDCDGASANDVWFEFIPAASSCRVDIVNTTYGNSANYGVEILEGSCNAPTVVLPCAVYNYMQALVLHNLTPGNTYYLRLYVPPADFKDFDICIRNLPAPPANDDCAQATVILPAGGIDCDQTYNGTTLSATQSGLSCFGEISDDVWYQFTATSTGHLIYLSVTGYPLGTGNIPGIQVFSGTDCANLNPFACFGYLYNNVQILNGLTAGETYFIRVYTSQNNPADFSICIGTLPLIPANNNCYDAVPVIPSPDMQCTQSVAGTTAGLPATSPSAYCYTTTGVWYHFKATAYSHFIKLQNVHHQYGDAFLRLGLFSGNCNYYMQNLACTEEQEILATNLTPGADYYIMVGGVAQSGTSFELCVLTPTQPVNDNCPGVVMLPVSPTVECLQMVSGTTLGATGSYGISCGIGPDVLFAFVATSAEHRVNISNVVHGYIFMEVLGGDCGNWNEQFGCFGAGDAFLSNLVPGKTYYLRIGTNYPSYANFDICITTPQPDLDIRSIQPYSNGCQAGSDESIQVLFANTGSANIPENAAQFTLTVSGANNGTYGPLSNTNILTNYYYDYGTLVFTGVDLSNPGESLLSVAATVPNDLNLNDNSESIVFTTLPLLTYYRDADGDGYGNADEPFDNCYPTPGYVSDNTDCDDNADWINPGATEVCNGIDDNCNGLADGVDPDLSGAPQPEITCPDNVVQSNDPGNCGAIINFTINTTDNCGYIFAQTLGLASGETFPVGSTLNSFTVSDPAGNEASCSFTVEIQKTAAPDLLYAYTMIGLNDVLLKNNIVQSGGIGVVNAGKKARLQLATTVTAPNTFVKAPILELTGASQVATIYTGQVAAGILPAFQANTTPSNNNINIANNSAPIILALASYGNVIVGINSTITFSGQETVRIKELTIKDGATVSFAQNTQVLINKGMAIAKNTHVYASAGQTVQIFAQENVTVDRGSNVSADIYTLKDLRLEKASLAVPTNMNGLFIASNVYAQDFAQWNWNPDCPLSPAANVVAAVAGRNDEQIAPSAALQIFPNPASEAAQLVFSVSADCEAMLRISDFTGKVLQIKRFAAVQGRNQYQLDLGDLPEGVYSVEVLAQGKREVEKLVVLRP